MAKSEALVREKMARNIINGGTDLTAALKETDNPLKLLLENKKVVQEQIIANIRESFTSGKWESNIKRAINEGRWESSLDRAGTNYASRVDDIVERSMSSYPGRAQCQDQAKAALKGEVRTTTAQREAYGLKYRTMTKACMDKLFGRTGSKGV